ncbi:ADP-ribose pyrophosphatase YjhB (NUDIX family) [Lentzea atacamensis]|uniref:ADP-ribose pyrophosphatase YjhB (NUDIX family) n=2 Tax=Lentzea TaxID=165301 RepID=A0A316HY81_9PSEU|nr:NUDIX hydrolase [Lentzea atacamensis]PWK86284.1 ADP-ribose pyrophosphatase YjhB (NUDIX family) [Lentzea atacamensis]RAS65791.1 ADP-ribose pyrophosphatase YjhB (NUDIX family) [Lentzea atacamensis]
MSAQHAGDPAAFAADVLEEGPAEVEYEPGIAARRPGKTSAGGALIRDSTGRVLFVVPTYKPVLDIPGGMTDENESPKAATIREIREELGLDVELGPLLVVDWTPRNGVWRDCHQFVFDGGIVDDASPHDDELEAVVYLSLDEARPRIYPSLHRRLTLALKALDAGTTFYAEFGREV